MTDLVQAADGADRLTQDEIVGTCVLLLMAGHEATVNVIGNGMLALLSDGDARCLAAGSSPTRRSLSTAAEELLRFDSSLQLFERTATRPVELFGVRVEAGQKIAALLGAANRDPEVFAAPDRFDVAARRRTPTSPSVPASTSASGAPLARVEVQAVLTALRSRCRGCASRRRPRRRPEFVIRGLEQLQVSATGVPPPG